MLFFSIVQMTAVALLTLLELAFFLRAVLSWFPIEENLFTDILYRLTEPFVYPIRRLLDRFRLFQNLPIDMSFLFAVILLMLLNSFVSAL